MIKDDLAKILEDHKLWITSYFSEGKKVDLREADLRGANLREADLWRADLWRANLREADLWRADLREADLWRADLREADLWRANLREADLREADLRGADLREADLRGADLRGADLRGAALSNFQICPEEGDFIAWKKVDDKVVKLMVSKEAKRTSSLVGRKNRAEFAMVLEIEGGLKVSVSDSSKFGGIDTTYKVGEIVRADKYDGDIRVECSHGIHFFMTRKEAEEF